MRFKLIACSIFTREISAVLCDSPHAVDPELLPISAHRNSAMLRAALQERIDTADGGETHYDSILLGYGLCGNSTVGLQARSVPIVLPRAHDCCTILLGSRMRFDQVFGQNPSMPFCSAGYLERSATSCLHDQIPGASDFSYEQLVATYGEENARSLYESLQPKKKEGEVSRAVFISFPGDPPGSYEAFCRSVAGPNVVCSRVDGDAVLLRNLVCGTWDERDFLIVKPGFRIAGVYDRDLVVEARDL